MPFALAENASSPQPPLMPIIILQCSVPILPGRRCTAEEIPEVGGDREHGNSCLEGREVGVDSPSCLVTMSASTS
jgi:hypothetical protein